MKELLPLLPKPSHYLGNEINAVYKDKSAVAVHVGLAFPDLYQVGMSYLGQKILYHQINKQEPYFAERVFCPSLEAARILRQHGSPLCTLETDTPVRELDVLALSLTHELCYTNILYLLDLAGIPFRARERGPEHPLVMAGGGAVFNSEPVADFLDLMVLGDGEDVTLRILEVIRAGKSRHLDKNALLHELKKIPGVYVPGFFSHQGPGLPPEPMYSDHALIRKHLVPDLNRIPFPTSQIVPYGSVIHDRLSVEIARGCTRGCRFCQAGQIYRPVRERSIPRILEDIREGLTATGMEELSFLSLSSGDFSALEELFNKSYNRCLQEQVAISLPSLRAGSVNKSLMRLMASIQRTQATLAPEAGTPRLRRVINKGISQEELLEHTSHLFELGWNSVKLYFMIGLPTETPEDIRGIRDLCLKVLETGSSRGKRLEVTASVAPFVPKPHTPFQWEPQISLEKAREKLFWLKDLFKPYKKLGLKWHSPEMSYLEGIFSRGGRELAPVVEQAYFCGEVFTSWSDCFHLDPWLDILHQNGLDPDSYLGERSPETYLPWEHLHSGVSRKHLLAERKRSLEGKSTRDCRYHQCRMCGVCDRKNRPSLLSTPDKKEEYAHVLNLDRRDQEIEGPPGSFQTRDLSLKQAHYCIWYQKTGLCIYLSQLELQTLLERAMRRAGWPLSFSRGYRPAPLITFGRALPVGVSSMAEWFSIYLRYPLEEGKILQDLNRNLTPGMHAFAVETLDPKVKPAPAKREEFRVEFHLSQEELEEAKRIWQDFESSPEFVVRKQTKKGTRDKDLQALVQHASWQGPACLDIVFNWQEEYLSPLFILQSIFPNYGMENMRITKTRQGL